MQTFLPYASFEASAASLDDARLGKQRVETLQILRALELPDYGWRNHPAVRMWRHRVPALVVYGLTCVGDWERRGFADTTRPQIAEFAPDCSAADQDELARKGLLPSWLGDDVFHQSHRSRLVAKNPAHYGPLFPDAPPGLDYVWPEPDDVEVRSAGPSAGSVDSLWIVRPESPIALGGFLASGVVGLGTASGVTFDINGHDLADIKAALGLSPGRRPGRALAALMDFALKPALGDKVGVEVDRGARLLVGRIASDYRFTAKGATGWEHHRITHWQEVVPRSSVTPPSALQDVRPFFPVTIAR
jgi:hypothetical protein